MLSHRQLGFLAVFHLGMLASCTAMAVSLEWNGFLSAYVQKQTGNVVPVGDSKEFDFQKGTKLGLNLQSEISQNWRAVAQITANGSQISGSATNNSSAGDITALKADWVFAMFQASDNFSIRVGRQLFPAWIYSEYIDVGYLHPWRAPPSDVYAVSPFKSFDGISAEYAIFFDEAAIKLRPFAGGSAGGVNNLAGVSFELNRMNWQAHALAARFDVGNATGASANNSATNNLPNLQAAGANTLTIGAKFDDGSILALSEFGRSSSAKSTSTPLLTGGTGRLLQDVHGGYATAGVHLGRFLPNFTYALADWKSAQTFGKSATNVLGLDFYAAQSIVIKAEYLNSTTTGGALLMERQGNSQSFSVGFDAVFK